jgi:hypothetical protein
VDIPIFNFHTKNDKKDEKKQENQKEGTYEKKLNGQGDRSFVKPVHNG